MSLEEQPEIAFEPGQVLCDRFRIERFIARGGMGEVYAAHDLELRVGVALKTIRREIAEDPLTLRRFKREITLARSVTHPNVCRIFDLFTHVDPHHRRPQLFLTMELLEGETLRSRLIKLGKMSPHIAGSMLRQLVAALACAHRAGVVHRDLKTDNIFLVPPPDGGAGDRVVVADFGLARSPHPIAGDESIATAENRWVGTPAYVSPEQLQGLPVDAASDIYSLGVVLYEMVTGSRPFEGPDPMSAAVRRLVEEPTSPGRLVKGLDRRWERVIMGCLQRDPRRRFQSADEVLEALEGRRAVPRPARRYVVAATIVVTAVIAAGIGLYVKLPPPQLLARKPAQRPSIAVMGFENLGTATDTSWLGSALTQMMASELAVGERLYLIPSEDVARVRVELGLGDARSLAHDTLTRVRTMLGSDLVILGSYLTIESDRGLELRLDLQVQDTTSGKIVASVTTHGGERELFALVANAGSETRRKLGMAPDSEVDAHDRQPVLPRDPTAARLYAQGLERLWELDTLGARRLLEAAVEAEPDFPLAQAALARAWGGLGYAPTAHEIAQRALDDSTKLSREARLVIQAQVHETANEWPQAIEIYRSLWTFFPENQYYGLRLAEAQLESGAAAEAGATLELVAERPELAPHPMVRILSARVANALSDYERAVGEAEAAATNARQLDAPTLLARARLETGGALWRLGESDAALAAFDEALILFREVGFRRGEASTLISLGTTHHDRGQLDKAQNLFTSALDLFQELGDVMGQGLALNHLGDLALQRGELDEAEVRLDAALLAFRDTGDSRLEARTLKQRAVIARRRGDLKRALSDYTTSHTILTDCGDRSGAAAALVSMAVVRRQLGELEQSAENLRTAIAMRRDLGHQRSLAVPLVNLANVELEMGDLGSAATHYDEARLVAMEVESPRHQSYAAFGLAEVALCRGELAAARTLHQSALALRRELGEQGAVLASLLALALVEIESDDPAAARSLLDEARELLRRSPAPDLEAWLWAVAARIDLIAGEIPEALPKVRRAESLLAGSDDHSARLFAQVTAARVELASGNAAAANLRMEQLLSEPMVAVARGARIEALIVAGQCALAHDAPELARQRLSAAHDLAAGAGYALLDQRATELLIGMTDQVIAR